MTDSPSPRSDAFGTAQRRLMDHPFLGLGFRPFYFVAAAFASISMPLWLVRYLGVSHSWARIDLNWHMHEMVFGFVLAVIVGFLFTAGRNWSGLWTPRQGHLALLVALWVAGRSAMLLAAPVVAAIVDLAFLPLAAWPFLRVLQRAGNKRNFFLVGLLLLLTICNAVFHAATLGWLNNSPVAAIQAAILVIVVIETAIGGRIIPMFTASTLPGTAVVTNPALDRISIGLTVIACAGWVAALPAPVFATLALGAVISQLVRLAGWKSWRTLHRPLLWILHVSYAWIAFGLCLLALSRFGLVSTSAAFHALAVGATAGLIIGMLTRTTLGHTGRPLMAGRADVAMYGLIQLGAVGRMVAAMQTGTPRTIALVVSMACWSSAFLLYLFVYGPFLFVARLDGKEG